MTVSKIDSAGALITGFVLGGPFFYGAVSMIFCSRDVKSPGGEFCDVCGMYCPLFMAWSPAAIVLLVCMAAWTYWRLKKARRGVVPMTSPQFWGAATAVVLLLQVVLGLQDNALREELLSNAKRAMPEATSIAP